MQYSAINTWKVIACCTVCQTPAKVRGLRRTPRELAAFGVSIISSSPRWSFKKLTWRATSSTSMNIRLKDQFQPHREWYLVSQKAWLSI
ncbi:hypothetical protein M3J09_000372 [Ascochyta lentis]